MLKAAKDCIDGQGLHGRREEEIAFGWRNRRGQISWINLIAMDARKADLMRFEWI